jgi:hypothetical protein
MAGSGSSPRTLSNMSARGQGNSKLIPAARKVKIIVKVASFQ